MSILFSVLVVGACSGLTFLAYKYRSQIKQFFARLFTRRADEVIEGEEADKVISEMEQEFWISDKGVLHNPLCRWYKKCDGMVWDGQSEHKNCGACGGDRPIVHKWNLKNK